MRIVRSSSMFCRWLRSCRSTRSSAACRSTGRRTAARGSTPARSTARARRVPLNTCRVAPPVGLRCLYRDSARLCAPCQIVRTDGPLGLYRGEPSPNPNPNTNPNPDPNLNPSPHPNQARYSHCCATRPRRACTFCCTRRVTRTPTLTLTLTLTPHPHPHPNPNPNPNPNPKA